MSKLEPLNTTHHSEVKFSADDEINVTYWLLHH